MERNVADWQDVLLRLERKYRQLVQLRQERESLESAGVMKLTGDAGDQRKAVARRLAEEFPGCLRELDTMDSAALEQRYREVMRERQAGADVTAAPLWMRVMADFHRLWACSLAIKRYVADQQMPLHLDDVKCFLRQQTYPVGLDVAWIQQVLQRQAGVSELVWLHLETQYGIPYGTLKKLLFFPKEVASQGIDE